MSLLSRSTVSIRFRGTDLDPTQLTELLGCSPTSAAKKGDKILKSNGETRIMRDGYWHLSSGEADSSEVEEKISVLIGKLTHDLNIWQSITQRYSADMFVGLFLDQWNECFELTPTTIKLLSDRNLKIGFDIYSR